MYGKFYGFREKPFSLLPDPDFLFPSRKHQMALNLLEMAIFNQSGFCVVSGEIGTGKTTLVRELLNRLDDNVCVGLISNTHDSFEELLGWILSAFSIEPECEEAVYQHRQFTDFLIRQYAEGRHTLLIIDEAQNLSLSAMEQLRMLSNVNSDKDLLLQVILTGQRELRSKLQMPGLAQFAQRISIDYHLAALDEKETAAYIAHRVLKAGGPERLFDDGACARVFRYSKGVPRLINRICDLGLVYGFADQARVISAELIETVARDQRLMPGSRDSRGNARPVVSDMDADNAAQAPAVATPLTRRAPPAAPKPVRPPVKVIENNNGAAQPGARIMNESSNEQTTDKSAPAAAVAAASTQTPEAAGAAAPKPDASPIEQLRAEAEKALAEKVRAEKLAADKATAAREAIERAAEERTAARLAASEKLAAEKLAAEKIIADRKAARQNAGSKSAAEVAANERRAAEQAAVALDRKVEKAAKVVDEEKLVADNLVFDRINVEKLAMEEAVRAKSAAEKALAERIAAEKAAAEVAAAADAAVRQALLERVAAERTAAERVSAVESAAEQARAEQVEARRIAAEKQEAEKAAISQADSDDALARQAARARESAKAAQLRLVAAAEQAAERANATRAAAEKAVAEHMAASRAAATKLTAEKMALAKVAASIATAAKQAAEQAEAAKAAALREASEKEAAAIDAARRAAEAEAAVQEAVNIENGAGADVVEMPRAAEAEQQAHPADRLVLGGAREGQQVTDARAGRKPGKTWAVMTIAAMAAGASLLAGKWADSGGERQLAAHKPATKATSVATMEVSGTVRETKREQ